MPQFTCTFGTLSVSSGRPLRWMCPAAGHKGEGWVREPQRLLPSLTNCERASPSASAGATAWGMSRQLPRGDCPSRCASAAAGRRRPQLPAGLAHLYFLLLGKVRGVGGGGPKNWRALGRRQPARWAQSGRALFGVCGFAATAVKRPLGIGCRCPPPHHLQVDGAAPQPCAPPRARGGGAGS